MGNTAKLTDEQKTTLADFVDAYREGSAKERKGVIKNALGILFPSVPEDGEDGKKRRRERLDTMRKPVTSYLANRGRRVKKPENRTRAWSLPQVVGKIHKEEIDELCRTASGKPGGSTGFFSVYQKVLSKFVERLTEEDKQKYRKMAEEWTERSPPEAVQQELAEKHALKYVEGFAKKMWTRLGIRIFVLTAQKDKNGSVEISDYDFNGDLGGKPFAEVRPQWMEKPILHEWARYAGDVLDGDIEDSGSEGDGPYKKKKRVIELEVGQDGRPLLPDTVADGSLAFDDLHPIVREYMTMNYRLDSGHKKAVVPWGAIGSQQEDFIEDQFLPSDFTLEKDPSKMNKTQISELLEYWYKRQNNPRIPVPFRFKGYKLRGTGEIAKVDRKGKGKVSNTKGPPKKGKTGKVTKEVEEQESSSNSVSDSNADTDSDSDNDTDSETDSPKTKVKANRSGRKEEPKSAAEARMKKLQAARERALQQAKKKFLEEMKGGDDDGGDNVGTSGPRGKKRMLDAGSDGDHSDADGTHQKGKKKEKLESPPRKMTTRSRGAVDSTGLAGKRRSERGSK